MQAFGVAAHQVAAGLHDEQLRDVLTGVRGRVHQPVRLPGLISERERPVTCVVTGGLPAQVGVQLAREVTGLLDREAEPHQGETQLFESHSRALASHAAHISSATAR